MKKIVSALSALIMTASCMGTTAYAGSLSVVDPLPNITGNEPITVEDSPELWEKFLRYDLQISDYDSLTDEEKDLCRYIFETEQSSTVSIRCERARRTLRHENLGERLTIESALNSYGIYDYYNPRNTDKLYFTHCVPDIMYIDDAVNRNEYWLDDECTKKIVTYYSEPDDINRANRFKVIDCMCDEWYYDDTYDVWYYNAEDVIDLSTYYFVDFDFKEYPEENMLTVDDITYGICPDNTLTVLDGTNAMGSVQIPEYIGDYKVTSISPSAFSTGFVDKTHITSIELPESMEYIGTSAFFNCKELTEIKLPENLKYLGSSAFKFTNLESLNIDCPDLFIASSAFYETPVKYAKINAKTIEGSIFARCKQLESIYVGSDIETIGPFAFSDCMASFIDIKGDVKYIGVCAFDSLSEDLIVNMPGTAEIIGVLPASTGEVCRYINIKEPAHNNLKSDYIYSLKNPRRYYYLCKQLECTSDIEWLNGSIKYLDSLFYGDINGDNAITIADLVLLQNYLMGNGTVGYEADINQDGVIDSFDLILMRQTYLDNNRLKPR